METATVSYKLIKKIKDDKFDIDHLHHYSLLLQFGARDFQVGIIDTRTNKVLFLEDFILASVKSYSQLKSVLTEIFDKHHLLQAGFWKTVKISIKNNKFTLVPPALFDKNELGNYLKLNAKVDPQSEVFLYYKNINTSAVTVFAMNKMIYEWLQEVYPRQEIGFIHQSSALAEGAFNFAKNLKGNTLYLYVDRFKLHIISIENGKLLYYNQFIIKQFSDYINYIMLVLKGLNHDQNKSKVVIWGYIGKQSPHYNEFYKYIKNISFGDRPDYLKFGYMFDEVQDHQFFDLYSMHLCD